jgi:hypothetical protein
MGAQAKPYEIVSDERLQSLIDKYKRQYIRERQKNDREVLDTVMALIELREMRVLFRAMVKAGAA